MTFFGNRDQNNALYVCVSIRSMKTASSAERRIFQRRYSKWAVNGGGVYFAQRHSYYSVKKELCQCRKASQNNKKSQCKERNGGLDWQMRKKKPAHSIFTELSECFSMVLYSDLFPSTLDTEALKLSVHEKAQVSPLLPTSSCAH